MFTGIVEGKRRVVRAERSAGALDLGIELGALAEGVALGDSIAVDGCCLTVSALEGSVARFHVMAESLGLTTFARLAPGQAVNVERSLRVGDRLGGHFVSGHVDGTGEVVAIERAEGQWDVTVELPEALVEYAVLKGSIALDGVSLTLTAVAGRRVSVALIPHTLEVTTLGERRVGDRINVEMDLIGKWVLRLVGPYLGREP